MPHGTSVIQFTQYRDVAVLLWCFLEIVNIRKHLLELGSLELGCLTLRHLIILGQLYYPMNTAQDTYLFAHAKPMVLLCTHVCHLNDVVSKRPCGSLVQETMQHLVLASVCEQWSQRAVVAVC